MELSLQSAVVAFLAMLCCVTTSWSQTPTPTQTPTCTDDTWAATTTTNAPTGRDFHRWVWTGREMIVWGGYNNGIYPNTGGRYNPGADNWTATSTTNVPAGRADHTAVWTGTEMIVWGGVLFNNGGPFNTGGRYDPGTDSWTAISTTNAPSARYLHTAIWTGTEMIVWAGTSGFPVFDTGGRYNPGTDSWTTTSTTNAPAARFFHTAVWTGSEMIVWGGTNGHYGSEFNSGGRYNPATNTWTPVSTINAPTARDSHTAVWTGSEMIVWGGNSFDGTHNYYLNTGGRYNPTTDTWTATSIANAPSIRIQHTAVWTGSEMIIWGGCDTTVCFDTGGRYNPVADTWATTSITNAPTGRDSHTAVWSGSEMIVWGGFASGSVYPNTGGRYCAQSTTPTPTPVPNVAISGVISYCSNPIPGPVPNVILNLTGTMSGSTISDNFGNYIFSSLPSGGSYTVTPSKAPRLSGSPGIDTLDVVATQRHLLVIGTPLSGCRLSAGDVNGDSAVNTIDVVAIQRFFLGLTTGIANVGKYQFSPASRSYSGIVSDQTGQNYDTLILGDVASPFVE